VNVTTPPAPAADLPPAEVPAAEPAPAVFAAAPLDALFRRNAAARPQALAAIDPPDRASFTDGSPRQLTYAEAELAVRKLARRLRSLGLAKESVVALALPNIVEATISLLAILRAGYVAAPVPALWGRTDLVRALDPINAKALITLSRLGDDRPAEVACAAAAELFSLSFPCAFGRTAPDGAVPLDLDQLGSEAGLESEETPAHTDAIAIITFDAAPRGSFAVARSHREWTAAGLATLIAAAIEPGDTIVTSLPPASLAGIGGAFVPWLLSGGSLRLLSGPVSEVFASVESKTHLLAPAASLVGSDATILGSCIAVHRTPETRALDFATLAAKNVVDLTVFGEIGMLAVKREATERAAALPLGAVVAPHAREGSPPVIETRVIDGELALSGAMVPRRVFPGTALNARSIAPRLEADKDGFVRTGFRARADGGAFVVEAAPADIAAVGALRFGLDDLTSRVAAAAGNVTIDVQKDPLLGARLVIEADDPAAAASALEHAGCSRLLVETVTGRKAARRAAG
jgi:hypothetical protein